MKFYITCCLLFLTLTIVKADDLAFKVTDTQKGNSNGAIDLNINGGASPYLINWTGPNGFTSKMEDIDNLVAGTYTVTVTDNYCGTASSTVTVKDFITNIDELSAEQILLFPNPALTEVQLSFPDSFKNYQLKIVNALGETMQEKNNLAVSFLTLDVTLLRAGIYFIEIRKDDRVFRKKMIKN